MTARFALLSATLLAAALLAGCAADEGTPTPTTTGGTPATSTPATSTPATSTPVTSTPVASTPATTTPVTSTPVATTPVTPTPTTPAANVSRVVVLSAPDRVAPNATAEVCFRVEGSGEIPHVAVHWDRVSHPNATGFSEYAGGAAYPGGGANSPRVRLPGVFCANLTAPASGALYYRAHALVPTAQPGVLSVEKTLEVGEPAAIHFVGDLPEAAPANTNVTACWRVPGATGSVPHTAIHWDTESHPNATFSAYDGGAVYPGNQTAAAGPYDLAGVFCANVRTPSSGALYFRAHVMGGSFAAPGALSAERSIVVAPRVNLERALPDAAPAGSKVNVCWRAEGAGVTPHTAVHWDTRSHPAATSFTEYAGGALYTGNGTAAAATQTLPGPWCAELTMPASGAVFLRAHVVYPGVGLPGELSDEASVRVG